MFMLIQGGDIYSSLVARRPVEIEVPGSNPAVVFREGRKTRGAVCIRMHLRSCADLKEPGWPSESLGVQKQTDGAGMHKRPENGMWLPTGGQMENGRIRISS